VGRKGRGDHERPGRHGGWPGRGRERPEGGAAVRAEGGRQDGGVGYKDRVHERLDRMDERLERHLKGGDA
jgi:hypothetical protein